MKEKKVLLAGESWETYSTHLKGFDPFYTNAYEEGADWLIAALEEAGFTVDFLPNHRAGRDFPQTMEEINEYSTVILSDIGANTLLLHPDTFEKSQPTPNRLKLLREYVAEGGSLLMVGGYMSFQGINGRAQYKDTPIEEILPVDLQANDDRQEVPEGMNPKVVSEHEVVAGLEQEWPMLLGYNKLKAKSAAEVLAVWGDDPILVVGEHKQGRTAAFASDCAPHWGSNDFVEWNNYNKLWGQLVSWLSRT